MKKRSREIVYLIVLLLIIIFFVMPYVAQMLGWIPTQISAIDYQNNNIGIRIQYPLPDDQSDWKWREKPMTGAKSGVFLEMANAKNKAYVAFILMPLPSGDLQEWLKNNRTNSGKYDNMKYNVLKVGEQRWIEEVADYAHEDKKLRYYTVCKEHKGNLLLIESYANPGEFNAILPFFKGLVESTKLLN